MHGKLIIQSTIELLERRTLLSAYIVSNLNDSGPGSLRDAIEQANTNAGADTIAFASGLSGTIALTGGDLTCIDGLTITGPGPSALAVSGGGFLDDGYLSHNSTSALDISGLAIHGGGVVGNLSGTQITLTNCVLDGSTGNGNGVTNVGFSVIRGCTISHYGAGIGGTSQWGGNGPFDISDSTLSENGAGIYLPIGSIFGGSLTNCTITGNGDGIYDSAGQLSVTRCTISDNAGYGIYNNEEGVSVIDSTISGNGKSGIAGGVSGIGEAGYGIIGSTIANNKGSGISYIGVADVISSTLANNMGGGIDALGRLVVTNSTIVGNVGKTAGGVVIGNATTSGGWIINNSIIAGNHGPDGGASDIFAYPNTPLTGANNVIGTGGSGGLVDGEDGNIVGVTDPKLAPLGDYGGPTQTMPPLAGSPAIDAGSNALALGRFETGPHRQPLVGDQRGYYRIVNGTVDIGSVEFNSTPLLPGDANGDGKVDFSDLLVLAQNYNKPNAMFWDQGDFNYDAKVDFADLLRLSQNYGKSLGGPAAAVPAASTGILAPAAAVPAAPLVISGTDGNDAITVATGPGNTLVATVNDTTKTYTADQYAGGITIDTGNATGTGDTLNIDGLPAVAAMVKGEGALAVTVGVPDLGERGTQDIAASPLTIEGSPAGTTKLTIDDSGDPTARTVTLDAFTAGGSTYGTVQGLAPGVINFNGANMASVGVAAGRNTINAVTVNNTPGGGRIFIANLASAVVLGTAPGQLLDLFRTFRPDVRAEMTVDFSTGHIGANSFINAHTPSLSVRGRSPTDLFSGAGFIHEADGVKVGYDDLDIDTLHLSNGTYDSFNFQWPIISLDLGAYAAITLTGPFNLFNGLSVDSSSSLTLLPNPWDGNPAYGLNVIGSLSVAGKLDLMNNDLETSTPLDQIRSLVLRGLGGTSGITSSRVDASHSLGYRQETSGASEVRLTLNADADLDGEVGFVDLLLVAKSYGRTDADWYHGDFNYDGKTDFADFLRVCQGYGKSLGEQTVVRRRLLHRS